MPKWLDDPFSDMPKSDVQMIEDLIDDLAMFFKSYTLSRKITFIKNK